MSQSQSKSLPIVAVLGATGAQGGGVIKALLVESPRHPIPEFHIRALASDITRPQAKALAELPNVSVVQVDTESEDSVLSAFCDAEVIFATTAFPLGLFMTKGPAAATDLEARQGINIVRAASKTPSLKHFIWSTLPNSEKLSGGKRSVPHFQAKVVPEQFIRSPESNGLDRKTTIVSIGMYGSNLKMAVYTPVFVKGANKYTVSLPCGPDVQLPWVGDESNLGTVTRAIISRSTETFGKYACVSAEFMSCRDWISAFTRATGKEALYTEIALASYEELWGPFGTEIGVMMKYLDEVGGDAWTDAEKPGMKALLLPKDLGVEDSELISTEECLRKMDWDAIL